MLGMLIKKNELIKSRDGEFKRGDSCDIVRASQNRGENKRYNRFIPKGKVLFYVP